MATVCFENVWKRYGTVEAVKELELTCNQGEMLALLGPSGCGKSSILKMVAGVEDVSEGEITFDGHPISHLAPGARNIAMVFEDYALYPHLTAEANIAFPLKARAVPSRQAAERIDEIIALLSLDDVRQQKVSGLSGGAQQRISIGRALVRDPELILFDEPLSHLDGDQKVQLRSEIKRLQQTANLTSILVTHDQSEAIAMADRVAVMDHGVLQQVGSPQELYDTPMNLFVANFIGEPPMNLFEISIRQDGARMRVSRPGWSFDFDADAFQTISSHLADESVTIGFRSEDVRIIPQGEMSGDDRPLAAKPVQARIGYIEPRGDSDVLTLVPADGDEIHAEIEGPAGFSVDDIVFLTVAPSALHFFSTKTGASLGRVKRTVQ